MADPNAYVEHIRPSTGQQLFDCQYVRFGEIGHVNVVADARAGVRLVIVPEDCYRSSGQDSPKERWDQVLRFVLFAEPGFQVCSTRGKVSQSDAAQLFSHFIILSPSTLDSSYGAYGLQRKLSALSRATIFGVIIDSAR
jgi:hypothetical protein